MKHAKSRVIGITMIENLELELPLQQPLTALAMHAFLALASESRPEKIPPAIARCTCHAVLADVCYLLSAPVQGTITCFDGFNRVKEQFTAGRTFPAEQFPEISACLVKDQPLIANQPRSLSINSQKLIAELGETGPSPCCVIPITNTESKIPGALLLLSPYSQREWSKTDTIQIRSLTTAIARILERARRNMETEARLHEYQEEPHPVFKNQGEWIEESSNQNNRVDSSEKVSHSRIDTFTRAEDSTASLQAENEMLLNEITDLHAQLTQIRTRAASSLLNDSEANARESMEQIREELQEMLTSLSAITGYHDLLLSESVGSLTLMQQRFLERIRSAADKLHESIDEIDQITQEGSVEIKEKPVKHVDLAHVIDGAFGQLQNMIHDRELEIRLLSPQNVPEIIGNPQEIQPVVEKILHSLLSISPERSQIHSRISLQVEPNGDQNVLWVVSSRAESEIAPGKELDEFSEYLQENVFSLADRLKCQLWMDSLVKTERQVSLLFATERQKEEE